MGLLSGIVGLFTKSDKAVEAGLDLVKKGADGIDALFYTEEEKAAASAEMAQLKLKYAELNHEFVKTTLNESTTRSYTRRVMAWGVMGLGMFLTLFSLLAYTLSARWKDPAYADISKRALELLQVWWPIILAVAAFYYGVHLLRGKQEKQ